MRPAVRAAFRGYTESLEGRTRFLYADVKGLVTVSAGCMLPTVETALALGWWIGPREATAAEIRDDFATIAAIGHNNQVADRQAALTSIRLTDGGVDSLLWNRLNGNAEWLRKHLFPRFPAFSADAQLGILSTAWGVGCDFLHTKPPRPELVAAIDAGDRGEGD